MRTWMFAGPATGKADEHNGNDNGQSRAKTSYEAGEYRANEDHFEEHGDFFS